MYSVDIPSTATAQEYIHVGSPTRTRHPPRRFWFEIAAVLAAKLVALTAIYLLFFSTPIRPDMAAHLFQIGAGR